MGIEITSPDTQKRMQKELLTGLHGGYNNYDIKVVDFFSNDNIKIIEVGA